jgi:allantoinase
MVPADLVIRADRVILPNGEHAATVVVDRGVIIEIAPPGVPVEALTVVDVPADRVLLPGLVDTHVHVNEPGRTAWEGFATATAAAAAGGITTIVDMPLNSIPATVSVPSLLIKQAAARDQVDIDVAFWGGAIPGNVDDLKPLSEAGVVGFKCFMLPSGVEEFRPLDAGGMLEAMTRIASFGGLLIAHAELQAVIDAAPAAEGRSYRGFVASRPPAAEQAAIELLIETSRATGCRTHIVHLSAAAALPAIRAAKADGLPLTVETCPHYLALLAESVPDGDTSFKCCPPIRDEANREQLWQALEEGLIDQVVSDHSPCTPELKALGSGDFGAAWGGIASVQLSLSVVWSEASRRGISLVDLARWMAERPAQLAGLAGKGAIAQGNDADFAVFAPEESFAVDSARLRHRHPVTPYAGDTLRGVVHETYLAGQLVVPGAGQGRLLRRSTP